ncbi:hypothetical protein DNTS_023799 [Danionella cerebrum]|uniref:Uncharacterized protein n=1 Tax=Danionella cerebrum TaxID=2873325 RepID=A0A553QQF9_9TELE|nr:hypothetical protein DNTS_023799 [Danionella translucida]
MVVFEYVMECVSRYSTSSVQSFSDGRRPRLHSCFLEESSILRDDSRPEGESLVDHPSDGESFVGYHGDHQFIPGGSHQLDWSFRDHKQGSKRGVVREMGNNYFLSVDVRGFEPHEVVVLAYNQCVVAGADGIVLDRFSQKSLLPSDMDPLSVTASRTDNILMVWIRRAQNKPQERCVLENTYH